MGKRLFGTDGIRGIANEHPMTADMALKVGRAAGHIFAREDQQSTILIGKDTRLSGYMFENALTAGLTSMGCHVLVTGPLPTPGVSYIMRSLRCEGAIMISASHNPYHDNGIKFFGPDGFKIADKIEDDIQNLVETGAVDHLKTDPDHVASARRIDDAVGRYIEFTKSSFPKGMRLDGLRIVVDCANGATYKVGPSVLAELGAEVIPIHHRPTGRNINENCGAVHPEDMRATVIRERADAGISYDGDGDRIMMADADGRLLDGNALLTILALDLIDRGLLHDQTVVTTIMANGGLLRALEPHGARVELTKVGDRHVVEAMRNGGWVLGGESSGHVVMLEHNTTGDAVITGLQVLAAMLRKGQPLSELGRAYQALPEAHRKVPLNGKSSPSEQQLDTVRTEAAAELGDQGRCVIRPSGTEPIVRVMIQHDSQGEAERLAEKYGERIAAL